MSRRPRIPLALRGMLQEPSVALDLELAAPASQPLDAPPVRQGQVQLAPPARSAPLELAPPAPTRRADLDDGSVHLRSLDLAPAVDVAPESLRTQVFAVRVEPARLPALEPTRGAALLQPPASAPVEPLPAPATRRDLPEATRSLRLRPTPTERLERDVLRACLTALFRASGSSDAHDLRLVGVFAPAPVRAIASVALGEGGVRVGVKPGARAEAGLLIVGRRRSSGALVTAEVGPDGEPLPAAARRRR